MVNVTVYPNKTIKVKVSQRTSTVNIITAQKKTVDIVANNATLVSTQDPVTLKNVPTLYTKGAEYLSDLKDVDNTSVSDGLPLVYSQNTNTFVFEPLDLSHTQGNIDGGDNF